MLRCRGSLSGSCSNAHIYEARLAMWKYSHQQSGQQCHIKVKALCGHNTDHNQWSGAAHRTMTLMQQLNCILAVRGLGHGCYVYSSMGGLPEPLLGPAVMSSFWWRAPQGCRSWCAACPKPHLATQRVQAPAHHPCHSIHPHGDMDRGRGPGHFCLGSAP